MQPVPVLDKFIRMTTPVYLDHAATTPVRDEVMAAMAPFFGSRFGNPSSVHRWGREARVSLDEARERLVAVSAPTLTKCASHPAERKQTILRC